MRPMGAHGATTIRIKFPEKSPAQNVLDRDNFGQNNPEGVIILHVLVMGAPSGHPYAHPMGVHYRAPI